MRGILATLRLFLILSIAMYLAGGAVNASTRTRSSMSETFYFCAVTALTIGYGDVMPTTAIGRIVAVLLGFARFAIDGRVTTACVINGIRAAARRAGIVPR